MRYAGHDVLSDNLRVTGRESLARARAGHEPLRAAACSRRQARRFEKSDRIGVVRVGDFRMFWRAA